MSLDALINEMHNTPAGRGNWIKVLQPDYKYDKDGTFSLDHYLTKEDAQAVLVPLRAIVGMKAQIEGCGTYAAPPFTVDEETGLYKFKYKQDAMAHPKNGDPFSIVIDVFDAQMNPWPRNVLIGNDSIVKVCFTMWPWNVTARGGIGVRLRPRAIQVIKHVEYEAENKDYGFKAEEGTDMGKQPFQDDPAPTPGPAGVGAAANPYDQSTGGPVVDDIPF